MCVCVGGGGVSMSYVVNYYPVRARAARGRVIVLSVSRFVCLSVCLFVCTNSGF